MRLDPRSIKRHMEQCAPRSVQKVLEERGLQLFKDGRQILQRNQERLERVAGVAERVAVGDGRDAVAAMGAVARLTDSSTKVAELAAKLSGELRGETGGLVIVVRDLTLPGERPDDLAASPALPATGTVE